MNLVLTVYGMSAFKEYLLPSIDNANYSIVIEGALFGMEDDVNLNLEVVDRRKVNLSDDYILEADCEVNDIYNIKKGDRKTLVFFSKYQFEMIVGEVSDDTFITEKYDITKLNKILIGRDESNDICFDGMRLVGKFHANIYRTGGGFILRDCSKNGTFINGRRIKEHGSVNDMECELYYGDCIDIFGLRIIYMNNFIAIRKQDGIIISDGLVKADIKEFIVDLPKNTVERNFFHRSPRFIPEIDIESIEIEAPPEERNGDRRPLFMVIGQPLTMMLPMILGSMLMNFSRGGSRAFMYMGLITSVGSAFTGTTWALINLKHAKKQEKEYNENRLAKYGKYLEKKNIEVEEKYKGT